MEESAGVEPAPVQGGDPGPAQVEAVVVQGYARALMESLGRQGRAPFVLAGLALWEDLQAIQASLARCLAWREETRLRHWHDTLAEVLPAYGPFFAEVQQGKEWVETLRSILDEAPLPTREEPGPGGNEVARRFAHGLGWLAAQEELCPWLQEFRQHLFAVSERYWGGLFACYDVVGLPRTTNDLEGLFGQTKQALRRQTGLRQVRRPLQRQGAWLFYWSQERTAADLYRRLSQVPVEAYRAERKRFARRQESFRSRHQWRRRRGAVLAYLESLWALPPPDSS
jgi:hypothetical protein